MSLRQRQSIPTTSPTPTQNQNQNQSQPATVPRSKVALPWYQYPLNLILARTLRFLGKFGFWIHNLQYHPRGIPVTRNLKVRMRDGVDIVVHIYERSPSSSPSSSSPNPTSASNSNSAHSTKLGDGSNGKGRPCVINFHGGGFTIGSATDDSRWARWCTHTNLTDQSNSTSSTSTSNTDPSHGDDLGAIFISIEYRLAPEYPYPTPVNDCIDVTSYVIQHAQEFGIDKERVFLSGFSAGGSLAITTAIALSPSYTSSPPPSITSTSSSPISPSSSHISTQGPNSRSPNEQLEAGAKNPIAGVIAFYPVLDFHTPRSIKRSKAITHSHSKGGKVKPLPGWMTRMFDTSYLPPSSVNGIDRLDPMISPGLAPESVLDDFPNLHLVLCGADVLAIEGREFGERLRELEGRGGLEREVIIRDVPGARHGWDKPPLPLQSSVSVEYDAAIQSMKRWCR